MTFNNNIHVLFLTRWYPHRYDPMPGLFIERHAEAVAGYCKVSVLYVHSDRELKKNHEIVSETKNGVFAVRVYYRAVGHQIPILSSMQKAYRFLRYHYRGIRIIKRANDKPDIIHVNVLTRHGLLAYIHKLICKTPYIITEHWSRYLPVTNTYKGYFRKLLTRIVVKNACTVTTVSNNLREAMLSHGLKCKAYMVVPNVVDTEIFKPSDTKTRRDKKNIIHISCFEDRSKNISGILRVIKKLSGQRDDFQLHLVGEGIDLDALVDLAHQLEIFDKFAFFEGLLENQPLVESLNNSDFMLMFSNYENMPVVINESLSCGIPVISSDVGGIAEIISEKYGTLVNSGDEDTLLNTINYYLDHPDGFDKKELRDFAIAHFSKEAIGKQFYGIYLEGLKRSSML